MFHKLYTNYNLKKSNIFFSFHIYGFINILSLQKYRYIKYICTNI